MLNTIVCQQLHDLYMHDCTENSILSVTGDYTGDTGDHDYSKVPNIRNSDYKKVHDGCEFAFFSDDKKLIQKERDGVHLGSYMVGGGYAFPGRQFQHQ